MGKRWTKQKAGQQAKKRRRKAQAGTGDTAAAGGTIGGMRRFTRGLFAGKKSNKPKSTPGKVLDWLLWAAVVVAAYMLISNRCMR